MSRGWLQLIDVTGDDFRDDTRDNFRDDIGETTLGIIRR